jgi:CubicO group peptidase (beta-lactamase class C family)
VLKIDGVVAPGFEAVGQAFEENFKSRGELGASVCAYWRGQQVVHLWGGVADLPTQRPFTADTPSVVFSSTKGLAALCMLMLADRGQLNYDAPVVTYWPEFGRAGKERVTVRQLLNHRSGLNAIDQPLTLEDFLKDRLSGALEAQAPLWEPGTDQGYCGVSFGPYVSELFRRVAGERLGAFFAREVAKPLNAQATIGDPDALREPPATLYPITKRAALELLPKRLLARDVDGRVLRQFLTPRSTTARAFANPVQLGPRGIANFNNPNVQRLELAWAGGIATAQGLAKIYAALAAGGSLDGVKLVAPTSLTPIHQRQSWAFDRVIRKPMGWSQGFLKDELHVFSQNTEAFGHPGAGGALGLADPVAELSIGYVPNAMAPYVRSPRALALCHALYRCLK